MVRGGVAGVSMFYFIKGHVSRRSGSKPLFSDIVFGCFY